MTRTQTNNKHSDDKAADFRGKILAWYDRHRRTLPWRAEKGRKPDPYHVWLSEIMLQQTTVGAVAPYYREFLAKWPDIHSLAAAPQEDIMRAWAGLGYYARARNLHACAKVVANDLKGRFPEDQTALKKLPGIGDYTSAAIRAIAFNKEAVVVDGNVERIMARIFAVKEPLPQSKPRLKKLAAGFFDDFHERPGDLAQALMDLGATICIPKKPRCSLCPVHTQCRAYGQGKAETYPKKSKPSAKPQKFGYVYWITNNRGEVLLEKRPEKGMLGGMMGLPTSEWVSDSSGLKHHRLINGKKPKDFSSHSNILHSFTHFDLRLTPRTVKYTPKTSPGRQFRWVNRREIAEIGLPSLFKKAYRFFNQEIP